MREFLLRRQLCLLCLVLAGVHASGQPESTVKSTGEDSPWHAEIATFESAALADATTDANDGIRVLTLGDALQITLDSNPSLAAKRAELGVAEGELRQASIYFQHNPVIEAWAARRQIPGSTDVDPSAGLSLGPRDLRVPYVASRAIESLGGAAQPAPGEFASSLLSSGVEAANNRALGFSLDETLSKTDDEDYVDFGVEISQELEIFGQPKARRNAAQAGLDVKVAEIAVAAWDALAETRKAYYALQIAEARLRLNEEQLQFANELEALAKRRFEQGDIARTEYRQQEIQGSRFAATKALAELAVESARSELRLATGINSDEMLTAETDLPTPIDDILESCHGACTARGSVHDGGIELYDSVFVWKPAVAHGHIVGVFFNNIDAGNDGIEGVRAVAEHLHGLFGGAQAVGARDGHGACCTTGGC